MESIPDSVEIENMPPHIAGWCVAKIPGFVPAILKRWLRTHPHLPDQFCLIMCPVAEINAYGGVPKRIRELTDPRLSCRHFTGCSRPYYAIVLVGADAEARRNEIQALLPWSESYAVDITTQRTRLQLISAVEEIPGLHRADPARLLSALLARTELLKIM